jgi:hypothetical protein
MSKKLLFIGCDADWRRKYNRFIRRGKLTVQVRGNSISAILRGQIGGATNPNGENRVEIVVILSGLFVDDWCWIGRYIQLSLPWRQKLGDITGTTNVGIHKS